jgi:hypothetical protein
MAVIKETTYLQVLGGILLANGIFNVVIHNAPIFAGACILLGSSSILWARYRIHSHRP